MGRLILSKGDVQAENCSCVFGTSAIHSWRKYAASTMLVSYHTHRPIKDALAITILAVLIIINAQLPAAHYPENPLMPLVPSSMRKSTLVLLFFVTAIVLVLLTAVDAVSRQEAAVDALNRSAMLVEELGLSDLALFTEARYTRHLTLADRHSAFQDHPGSFDHFPSGSLHLPPSQLTP